MSEISTSANASSQGGIMQITNIEVREKTSFTGLEDFYIRDKHGGTFEVQNFFLLWQHFNSKNGYRISFPVGENTLMTIWREPDWTEEEIAEQNEDQSDLQTALHELALSNTENKVHNVIQLFANFEEETEE